MSDTETQLSFFMNLDLIIVVVDFAIPLLFIPLVFINRNQPIIRYRSIALMFFIVFCTALSELMTYFLKWSSNQSTLQKAFIARAIFGMIFF